MLTKIGKQRNNVPLNRLSVHFQSNGASALIYVTELQLIASEISGCINRFPMFGK